MKRLFRAVTFLPVLSRELREGSHRPFNYYLRLVAAAVALLLLWVVIRGVEKEMSAPSMGIFLFICLHVFLLIMIVSIVPLMTADCVAAEKRNGTLGLLFLTPLTPQGIMIGKSAAHAFRAFTLWFSVLPVLVVPFVLGGIGWFDVVTAVSLQFCTIVLSLAAGLLASTLFRKRNTAFIVAIVLSISFTFTFAILFDLAFVVQIFTPTRGFGWSQFLRGEFLHAIPFILGGYQGFFGGMRAGGSPAGWSAVLGTRVGYFAIWKSLLWQGVLAAILVLYLVMSFGALLIKRSWQDRSSRISSKWYKRFCTPVIFAPSLNRQMKRWLDRNPIAWLQQYSWRARSTKWGLCFGFILVETIAVMILENMTDIFDLMQGTQFILLLVASIMFVFVGVTGFQIEKETGALELILVTPLRVNQIIFGRVYGLWKQFLPAFLVIGSTNFLVTRFFFRPWDWYNRRNHPSGFDVADLLLYFILTVGFLVLPVFATYFALRVKNIIAAGILTTITLLLAPAFGVLVFIGGYDLLMHVTHWNNLFWLAAGTFFGNASFAAVAVFLLHHSLSRRIYSF